MITRQPKRTIGVVKTGVADVSQARSSSKRVLKGKLVLDLTYIG